MGGVLSKHSRVNQICTFQGKDFSDSQEDDDDTFMEPDIWFSDFYHFDKILTLENDSSYIKH